MIRKLFPLIFIVLSSLLHAQQVKISFNRSSLTTKEELVLSVEVTGEPPANPPEMPEIEGFQKTGAGVKTGTTGLQPVRTFIQRYRPLKAGYFEVPAFDIQIKNATWHFPGTVIEVTGKTVSANPSASAPIELKNAPGKDIFLTYIPEDEEVYTGQPVYVKGILFIRKEKNKDVLFGSDEIGKMLDGLHFTSAWEEKIPTSSVHASISEFRGKKYMVYPLYTGYIMPLKAGKLVFPEMRMEVKMRQAGGLEAVELVSEEQEIGVLDTPPGTEITGKVKLEVEAISGEVVTGQPFTLSIVLSGAANLQLWKPPALHAPKGMEVSEAKTALEMTAEETAFENRLKVSWTFTARQPGEYRIGGIQIAAFDPDREQLDTLRVPEFPVKVTGEPIAAADWQQDYYESALKNAESELERWNSAPVWMLWAGIVLLAIALGMKYILQKRRP